jgi:hypothetical protein
LEDIDLDKEVKSTRIKNGGYVDCLREQESAGRWEETCWKTNMKVVGLSQRLRAGPIALNTGSTEQQQKEFKI